ncbi:drug/metabolite transporter (DMT)-like permease [Constrictibacter sp. MBR-5]|jgi:drug/metabolite transporter (DMT)-like permease|uniref:DMT family transporter n=1 Tax=Constrictibacter sp. MBR-5 TaxID=3156467 RepID=UPI003394F424
MTLHTPVRIGLWMIVTAAAFGAMVGTVRYLSQEMDVFVISFWRNVFAALALVPWIMEAGAGALRTRRIGRFTVRSAIFVASTISLYMAVAMLPLAEATALSFTSPLFATMLAVWLLKEHVTAARWAAVAVGFIGVLVILRPGIAAFDPVSLIVLFSAATFAGVIVTGKQLADTESPELIVFYLSALAVPLSLPPALWAWQWPTMTQWGWLVLLGILAAINMYGVSRALRIGDASQTTPFDFIRLPCSALVGYLAFSEKPDVWTWIGAAVILGSSVFIARRETVAEEEEEAEGAPQKNVRMADTTS